MQKTYDFLKKMKTYFLSTVENDEPKVRPFGTIEIIDDKLCFQTGKKKEVSIQLHKNPNFEICAFDGDTWLRLSGKAYEYDNRDARKYMLDCYPELRGMYNEDDGNCELFEIKEGKSVFASFTKEPFTEEI